MSTAAWIALGLVVLGLVVLAVAALSLLRRLPALRDAVAVLRRRGEEARALQADLEALQERVAEVQERLRRRRGEASARPT